MCDRTKIAVIVGPSGSVCSADAGTGIAKYGKKDGIWEEGRGIPYSADLGGGLSAARASAEELCRGLADCRAIVGTSVAGALYRAFDRNGLAVLETTSFDPSDLPCLERLLDERPQNADSIGPEAVDDEGNYFIDMTSVQKAHPEFSSKMILKGFLEDAPFLSLEVVCEHVPPWIEEREDLELSSVSRPDGALLTIRRKACRRSLD
ncbi:MAG: hypothetical protein LBS92_01480 [Candidatus Methanoplasma sp.]|jgi:hypothetical protein|nr:hypothetical protein [Candidatus Methanoplasma sp.]